MKPMATYVKHCNTLETQQNLREPYKPMKQITACTVYTHVYTCNGCKVYMKPMVALQRPGYTRALSAPFNSTMPGAVSRDSNFLSDTGRRTADFAKLLEIRDSYMKPCKFIMQYEHDLSKPIQKPWGGGKFVYRPRYIGPFKGLYKDT